MSKSRKQLGWEPQVKFKDLVRIMVDHDLELVGLDPIGEGPAELKDKGLTWTNNELRYEPILD